MLFKILKSIFCKHTYIMIRKIKDEDAVKIGALSEWKCTKCNRLTFSQSSEVLK